MNLMACHHVKQYKEDNPRYKELYEVLYGNLITFTYLGSRKKKANSKCETCGATWKIYACMSCKYFACFKNIIFDHANNIYVFAKNTHIYDHAKNTHHLLAFDATFGYVYCFECKDYQYDSEFEEIAMLQQMKAPADNVYSVCDPTQYMCNYLRESNERLSGNNHKFYSIHNISETILGIRGIANLGKSTCFMSSILQVLFHAPVFRNFLLTNNHFCRTNGAEHSCLLKKLSKRAQEFFSESKATYIPYNCYLEIYKKLKEFRGSDHHDAVEFLSKYLDCLHCHADDVEKSPSCCIIGNLFMSSTAYELKCSICNKEEKKDFFSSMFYKEENIVEGTMNGAKVMSLEDLKWTTMNELKGKCCGNMPRIRRVESTIPIIIFFVLGKLTNKESNNKKKMENMVVNYPEVIDVRTCLSNSFGEVPKYDPDKNSNFLYYLFAVITHKGEGENSGHFFSYFKQHAKWFKGNDDAVTVIKSEDILKIKDLHSEETVYMLAYHKNVLE